MQRPYIGPYMCIHIYGTLYTLALYRCIHCRPFLGPLDGRRQRPKASLNSNMQRECPQSNTIWTASHLKKHHQLHHIPQLGHSLLHHAFTRRLPLTDIQSIPLRDINRRRRAHTWLPQILYDDPFSQRTSYLHAYYGRVNILVFGDRLGPDTIQF